MKIVVTGTRGIPDIPGGVETHCECLYPLIAAMGHEVTVMCRRPYVDNAHAGATEYKGVRLKVLPAVKKRSLEAMLHTFMSVVEARKLGADVVHLHAVGPSLMAPLARLLGMKVVMTHHGPDYNRDKWGAFARLILRWGECAGVRWSNGVIAISRPIAADVSRRYRRDDVAVIFNGVKPCHAVASTRYLDSKGIAPGRYVLAMGRFVKEKGFHDFVSACSGWMEAGFQVVLAGDSDHDDAYSRSLKADAADAGVILTGYVKGEALDELMSHAALFVLPSCHEGLPIVLLEAMSHGLDVMVSDIAPNRLEQLAPEDFFETGNVIDLQEKVLQKLRQATGHRRVYDMSQYSWPAIAEATEKVYRRILHH